MRISRLDLLRYGKFTDKSVPLPTADKDFHLIVGPNEAGKSTLRSAIQDLLFGIETRSRYNFLHPHSDMRLGASIEQNGTALDFVRTKARSKTLQTATGSALPDSVLSPFLGQVDRAFFDQMFGLNHERLVQGGKDILSASNDMGQILFQAAAGIGSLGQIREKLETEANALWAKRKSGDREFYAAAAELEQAEAALKVATVRTRDWQEASSKVSQIGDDLQNARQRYRALELERMGLERVRRTAPLLHTLKELERDLAELGQVVKLPADAAELLTRAEHDIAMATRSAQLFKEQHTDLSERMATLHTDEAVLVCSADIDALVDLRQQLRSVDVDIAKRQGELQVFWQEVQESVRQLGWPEEDEQAVSKRLPGALVKSALSNLIRRHEAVAQALASSAEALRHREQEVKTLELQIEALPQADPPAELVDALTTARAIGDVAAQEKQFETQVGRLQRDLGIATPELGQWHHKPEELSRLNVPTLDEINALMKRRTDLEVNEATLQQRVAELHSDIGTLQLECSQYKAAHHPVTLADVLKSRRDRDVTWHAIKSGSAVLKDAAIGYESQVSESDTLSDQRHDRAQQETEFQLKLDQLERLQRQISELSERHQQQVKALAEFDLVWSEQVNALGLPGMPLLKVNSWRSARDKVLLAAVALAEVQSAQSNLSARAAHARVALAEILKPLTPQTGPMTLQGLIVLADEWIKTATRSQERRSALLEQKISAQASITDLTNRKILAQEIVTTWQADFDKHLTLSHLPDSTQVVAAQEALDLFERMQGQLQKIRDIRINRIDAMRLALKGFDQQAQGLAAALAPDLVEKSADAIALTLGQRLKDAQAVSQELNRLALEIRDVADKLDGVNAQIASGQASLKPLLELSGTTEHEGLRQAIAKSDRCRSFTLQIDQSIKQLAGVADGLAREVLEVEISGTDLSAISIQLSGLKTQVEDIVEQQNACSGALNAATTALEKIAGQADAAKAEAQRQEALARMANAVDRFIKVHTAAKLLRWSIERFRESKQGPMLSRASDVFLALTQGAFCRLAVDYESEPLKLSGQRTSGELVDIEGLSEGTRDQLYLALRLAALELHLQKTIPLPFIADDLFINYDDGRAQAGLKALTHLSESTQVIFLTHHAHLVPVAQSVFGGRLNVVHLG